jgi:hypothetical protein
MSFYILNNIVTKQFYLFTTSKEKAKILKTLPKDTITFEFDINNYSVRDFKLLIFSLLEIPIEKQHLWIDNTNISNELANGVIANYTYQNKILDINFGKFPEILGYRYKNENGINYYDPNFLELDPSLLQKDFSDETVDTHSYILSDYGMEDNIINFIDYDSIDSMDSIENLEMIETIYYPNLKSLTRDEIDLNLKEYKTIFQKFNENINLYNDVNETKKKDNFSIKMNNLQISDLVLYGNINYYKELKLETIYNNLDLDDEIVFIKYRDVIKNDFLRLNKNGIYKIEKKRDIADDFTNYKKYFVEFEANKYEPIVSKKQLEYWKTNLHTVREKQYKIKNEVLVLKVNLSLGDIKSNIFVTIVIHLNGMIEVKLIDIDKKYIIEYDLKDMLIEKINSIIKDKIQKYDDEIKEFTPMNTTYLDFNVISNLNIDDEKIVKLIDIKKTIMKYFFMGYVIENDENNITLKYRANNLYNNYNNIKRFYLDLFENYTNLSVKDFGILWNEEAKIKFNLSSIDAVSIQNLINTDDVTELADSVDLLITNGDELNTFKVSILNSNKLENTDKIHKFIETIIYEILNKKKKKRLNIVEKPLVTIKKHVKQQTFDDEGDMDIGIDYNSESNSNNGNNDGKGNNDGNDGNDDGNDGNNNSNNEIETKMPKNIRAYMDNMRRKDKKLHIYPSSKTAIPYTTKCQAVDMRQPVILSTRDLENMKQKNMEGYLKIKDNIIKWGSSSKKLNNYICPRIWCIKCKIVLSEKQLIDNEGLCPICGGKIIEDKTKIKKKESLLIRKSSSGYWSGSMADIPDEIRLNLKYKSKWDNYLKGTEKTAYPSFLDSKIHPLNKCTLCCNSSQSFLDKKIKIGMPKNVQNCLKQDVDLIIDTEKDLLKIGKKINVSYKVFDKWIGQEKLFETKKEEDIILGNGNIILLLNNDKTNNFYKLTDKGPIILDELGNEKTNFINGMVVNNLNNKKSYYVYKLNNIIELKEFNQPTPDPKYILKPSYLGGILQQLPKNKYGILPIKLDKFFNEYRPHLSDEEWNGILPKSSHLILRKGIEQNHKFSFLQAMSSIITNNTSKTSYDTCEDYINGLIKDLKPHIFVSLNNGDIFKYFHEITDYSTNHGIFILWCKKYKTSLDNFRYSELENIVKDSYSTLKEDMNENMNLRHLYNIYISMENYKKYLCDMNIFKDYNLLIDLLSRFSNYNIFILEETERKQIKLINPINSDILNIYKDERPNIILYKVGLFYEPLYELEKNVNDNLLPEKIDFRKPQRILKVKKLKTLLETQDKINNNNNISFHRINPIINGTKYEMESILVDKYFKGIGILTKEQLVIHTLPFNVDFTTDFKYINEVPKLSVPDTIKRYNELYVFINQNLGVKLKLTELLVDDNSIHSILNNNNKYIKCVSSPYTDGKYGLKKTVEKSTQIDSKDLDDILFDDIFYNDNRIESNKNYKLKSHVYNNLKYEVSRFFKNEKIKLKEHLYFFIENNVIPIYVKREQIQNVIKSLINNLIIPNTPKIIDDTLSLNKECQKFTKEDCEKTLKCKLDSSKLVEVEFDKKKYKIDSKSCKLIIDEDNYDFFAESISEEILKFYTKRDEILNGNYKIPIIKKYDNNIIELNGLNYIDKIRDLFNQNKYLYVNDYFNMVFNTETQSKKIIPRNIQKLNTNSIQREVRPTNNNNSKIKTRYAVNFKYNPKTGRRLLSKQAKRGQCIFPFKNKKYSDPLQFDCVKGKDDSSWCATEIKPNLLKEEWGYCIPEGMTNEEYIESISSKPKKKLIVKTRPKKKLIVKTKSKNNSLPNNNNNNRSKLNVLPNNNNNRSKLNVLPNNNNNRSKLKERITVNYKYSPKTGRRLLSKQAKRGTCIFPFKNKKHTDPLQFDCVKGKDGSSWCATEIKPNLLKEEWGYCVPEGMTEEEYNRMYEN